MAKQLSQTQIKFSNHTISAIPTKQYQQQMLQPSQSQQIIKPLTMQQQLQQASVQILNGPGSSQIATFNPLQKQASKRRRPEGVTNVYRQ